MSRSALLAGTTGLVGGRLLNRLLAHPEYERVTVWVWRPVSLQIHKFSQLVVDFDRLDDYAAQLDAQDVYVALGTTIVVATHDVHLLSRVPHSQLMRLDRGRVSDPTGALRNPPRAEDEV